MAQAKPFQSCLDISGTASQIAYSWQRTPRLLMGSSSSNILVILCNSFPKVAKNMAQAVATLVLRGRSGKPRLTNDVTVFFLWSDWRKSTCTVVSFVQNIFILYLYIRCIPTFQMGHDFPGFSYHEFVNPQVLKYTAHQGAVRLATVTSKSGPMFCTF